MPDHAITPFTVSISDEAITDLRTRLRSTRWPEQLPGPAWQRGVPVDYLRRVANYWASDFDWRAEEKRINEFPQFTTRHRRPADSLPSRQVGGGGSHAAVAPARLAGLVCGVPGCDRLLRRPDGAWWHRGGRLPRRGAVAARFRLLGATGRRGMGQPQDGRSSS